MFLISTSGQKRLWILFFAFLGVNFILSDPTFPEVLRWGMGLALLKGLAARAVKPLGALPLSPRVELFPASGWIIGGGLLLALALRLYRLDGSSYWPTGDEAWNGMEALELSRGGTWKFFYTLGQAPPLPVWTSAALFKLGFPPGNSLWFPSAAASALTVIAGYFAARSFFSRSLSLLGAALLAFSFWPLYIGRFAHQGIWLPLWVCACFLLAGRFLRAQPGSRGREAAFLGLAAGLGSFTFTPWPAVAAVLGAVVFRESLGGRRKHPRELLIFAVFFILGLLPFLAAVCREGFGAHWLKMGGWNGFSFPHQVDILSHYFTVLFWGAFDSGAAYVPGWGGFLNPLLGAFFFLGVRGMIRARHRLRVGGFLAAFLVFLLPGLLSQGVEAFRVAQVLPLLLFPAAWGLASLLASLPARFRLGVLLALLLISAGWDLVRLAEPAPRLRPERWKAYQVLSDLNREQGPGLILTDFDTANDATLAVMTSPFNAARTPGLDPGKCRWLAVYVNVHYEPFLKRRFPEGRWLRTGEGRPSFDGGGLLAVFPLAGKNAPVLRRWWEAHRIFQQAERARFTQTDEGADRILSILERATPLVQGDPFLESCFWDKRAAYEYQNADYEGHLLCYRQALTRGYPTADLYHKLGLLLQVKGRRSEAREAFRKATQAPLDLTPARWELAALEAR